MEFKRSSVLLFGTILLTVILIGCLPSPGPENIANETGWTEEGVESVVNANNQFAFKLYSEYSKTSNENIFFSPYSISTAVGMAYEGAKGETASEIQSVFQFPQDEDTRRPAFAKIQNTINHGSDQYELYSANALWAEKSYPFKKDYFKVIEDRYAGKATNMDFNNTPEQSRVTINKWIEEKTKDKIKSPIPSGSITSDTGLVITNAIYLKGTWVKQFDKSKTKPTPFRVNSEKEIEVQMMRPTEDADFNYAETEDLQILEMPYKGDEVSMIVLLPKGKREEYSGRYFPINLTEEESLAKLEESLSAEKFQEWRGMLKETELMVYMPKFEFETRYKLNDDLKKMGMSSAFEFGKADFSGMDGTKYLYISEALHQAYVKVDEEGTEATASTQLIMMIGAAMTPEFRADHPFIFIIQQRETGNILFIGKVVDPTT